MLIVREVFTTKPGMAGKLSKMFRASMAGKGNVRVLTDLVGDYNTVVMEMQVENLAEWEQLMADYRSGKVAMESGMEEEWKSFNEKWLTGRREIWQVVE